ncbi:hypothetical protein CBR_g51826 [Chara braunii]|uniref:General transcription and DNA repair factor IIH subunit TFB5 n=1 Tax=Chara braunii TaxID=69332 RepID=A0A388M9E4_CHABU|nr:hypothetical protein CBR_g51826 [Chara braunii]|eukprot:GBG91092.1 hypothetical protein CBR_g51826 [Chara braunii]
MSISAIKGVIIECDIPMKQYILRMNSEMPNSQKFVLRDLDDTHLFVQANMVTLIKRKVEEFMESNTYEKPM